MWSAHCRIVVMDCVFPFRSWLWQSVLPDCRNSLDRKRNRGVCPVSSGRCIPAKCDTYALPGISSDVYTESWVNRERSSLYLSIWIYGYIVRPYPCTSSIIALHVSIKNCRNTSFSMGCHDKATPCAVRVHKARYGLVLIGFRIAPAGVTGCDTNH